MQAHRLARIRLVGFHNSDLMIGELVVAARQLDLGHMTGDALPFCNWTDLRSSFPGSMACFALRIVIRRTSADLRMRVMTRQAANACIVRVVASASRQAIGLKANIRDTEIPLDRNFCPGPVAPAAEIRRLLCCHVAQTLQSRCHSRLAAVA